MNHVERKVGLLDDIHKEIPLYYYSIHIILFFTLKKKSFIKLHVTVPKTLIRKKICWFGDF